MPAGKLNAFLVRPDSVQGYFAKGGRKPTSAVPSSGRRAYGERAEQGQDRLCEVQRGPRALFATTTVLITLLAAGMAAQAVAFLERPTG
jgi:hypothetical protein